MTDRSGSIPDGKAFFGYGDDIESTGGGIGGFICNWAGPESDHALLGYVQSQEVSYDSATGFYLSVAASIGYAPTTSCEYDGSSAFSYDTNADGAVDTDPATPVTNDLQSATDGDADGVFDEIGSAGFNQPDSPANL